MQTTWIRILLLTSLLVLSGGSHQYVMTLTNGTRLSAASKPRLEGNNYYYKDAPGRTVSIPAGRGGPLSGGFPAPARGRALQGPPGEEGRLWPYFRGSPLRG